jgi:hypothetical protein
MFGPRNALRFRNGLQENELGGCPIPFIASVTPTGDGGLVRNPEFAKDILVSEDNDSIPCAEDPPFFYPIISVEKIDLNKTGLFAITLCKILE